MTQSVFIPLTDELLDEHPELIALLVPFNPDLPCYHWLAKEEPESDPSLNQVIPRRAVG